MKSEKNNVYCEPFHIQKGYTFEVHHVRYKKGDPYSCLMHFHEVHEIILFEDIQGLFFCSNGESHIVNNDIVFTPAMETHYFDVKDEDKSWYVVQFLPELFKDKELQNVAGCLKYCAHMRLKEKDKEDVLTVVKWLQASYQDDPFSEKSRALLKLLLIWIGEKAELVDPGHQVLSSSVSRSCKLDPVLHLFRNQQTVELSLVEAADLCHMSSSYFSRTFKEMFRCNYSEYVMQHKLYNAARMLSQTNLSVTQISYDLNFSSPSHFVALFKKKFGQTPKKYKSSLNERADKTCLIEHK